MNTLAKRAMQYNTEFLFKQMLLCQLAIHSEVLNLDLNLISRTKMISIFIADLNEKGETITFSEEKRKIASGLIEGAHIS